MFELKNIVDTVITTLNYVPKYYALKYIDKYSRFDGFIPVSLEVSNLFIAISIYLTSTHYWWYPFALFVWYRYISYDTWQIVVKNLNYIIITIWVLLAIRNQQWKYYTIVYTGSYIWAYIDYLYTFNLTMMTDLRIRYFKYKIDKKFNKFDINPMYVFTSENQLTLMLNMQGELIYVQLKKFNKSIIED